MILAERVKRDEMAPRLPHRSRLTLQITTASINEILPRYAEVVNDGIKIYFLCSA
jgi:hypothetical protein